jgi:hypothetical protein
MTEIRTVGKIGELWYSRRSAHRSTKMASRGR